MALEIRAIPTLEGEDAERFLREAEHAEKNENKQDYSEMIRFVEKFLRENWL